MTPHWRCGNAPDPAPLRQPCPVHDASRPCVLASCSCNRSALLCDYCGAVAYKYDPFEQRPCCLDCFDQIIGGES